MIPTRTNEKFFWRHKASGYPRPFDPSIFKKTSRTIRRAESLGADFRGRDIIDIGCGTGIYALVLAKKAARVCGVDSSAEMLAKFREDAVSHGIGNATTMLTVWGDVNISRVRHKYDIAIASMTHAVIQPKELKKMEDSARELCVYIGWAGVRKNPFLEEVYAHHGALYKAPEGADEIIQLLERLGRKFKAAHFKDSWKCRGTPEATLAGIKMNLRVNGAVPDLPWLKKLIARRTRNGAITQTTTARKGLIVWRPDH